MGLDHRHGPAGLGDRADDIWGVDFAPGAGDHGDGDLQTAVAYAQEKGKRVTAVVAGHMHHTLKDGGQRRWHVERDGVHYVNAARVPRIDLGWHHHILLEIGADGVGVTAVAV